VDGDKYGNVDGSSYEQKRGGGQTIDGSDWTMTGFHEKWPKALNYSKMNYDNTLMTII